MRDKFASLVPLIGIYEKEMAAIEARRNEWTERVKPLLNGFFEALIERFKLLCHIGSHHQLKNQETLFFAFDDQPSGFRMSSL